MCWYGFSVPSAAKSEVTTRRLDLMRIPEPNHIKPGTEPALRWGVLAPGNIARSWVDGVQRHSNQKVVAVASSDLDRAKKFAQDFSIETVHKSYEALVSDPNVDAIYIASWQSNHLEHGELCISAGKPFLIEKPITYTASDARRLLEGAKNKGLLAVESMWTRYLPQSTIIDQLLASGELGSPELFTGIFAIDNRTIPRLWQKGGGGVVHDMGIYPISVAQQFLGNPSSIVAKGTITEDKIDAEAFVELGYESGARAVLIMSAMASLPQVVHCSFENAVLNIDAPFLTPSGLSLTDKEFYTTGSSWRDESGITGHEGLCYPAVAFASYLKQGLLESPIRSHADSIAAISVAEEIVRQLGAEPN